MSIGYTKLFSSIVTSTIWVESDRTRIVWITMLAMADRNGEIQASIPGLARLAGVPIPDCEEALAKFIAPDPYSRTPDDEGRRIEKIEGGWALLNHAKYREMASRDDSKAANTERQRRHREKEKRNATVTPCNATVTLGNAKVTPTLHIAEAEAEAEAEAGNTHTAPVPVAEGDEAPAADCPFPPEVAKKPSAKFRAESSEIPPTIATPEFIAAWADWCAYKRERGQTLRSRTAKAQLGEMNSWGESVAIAAIRKSIVNGWTGVFQPDSHGSRGKPVEKLEARFDIF